MRGAATAGRMLGLIRDESSHSVSSGERKPFVMQTVVSDDEATLGRGPEEPAPLPVGKALAWALEKVGPKGKEFGMYSLDYHTIRNFLYVKRHFGSDARESTRARVRAPRGGRVQHLRRGGRAIETHDDASVGAALRRLSRRDASRRRACAANPTHPPSCSEESTRESSNRGLLTRHRHRHQNHVTKRDATRARGR